MIRKQLTMIYEESTELKTKCFKSWKELHMHLFEHGLYKEFQVFDAGLSVLHYKVIETSEPDNKYDLKWDSSVPGSVLFGIVNRHASAKL